MTAERPGFQRFAGACAILAGIAGFLYSVAFVIVSRSAPQLGAGLSALFLLAGGLFGAVALVAVYRRLLEVDPGLVLAAFVFGMLGSFGAAIHGGYDLANAVNPPAGPGGDLPSQIDPRGLLTFGVSGLAIFAVAWVMRRSANFSSGLASLGFVSAVLLILIYLGRLIVLDASSPLILVPAGLEGFIVNPAWYVWLGLSLRGGAA